MSLRTMLLYWNTVRYLRVGQLFNRVRFRLARPKLDLAPAPALREHSGVWQAGAQRAQSMLGPNLFRFLNEDRQLDSWDDVNVGKLWRYNLHYFDDLNALDADSRRAWHYQLIERWIDENPPGSGTGWEPYPTSLRIVNWIKFALAGNPLPERALNSLAVQVRWLCGRIEWHLLANHLFSNAKALMFAGNFFSGAEADAWNKLATNILVKELTEQILADGGQFERSTMYHALATEDLLDLVNLARTFGDPNAYRQFVGIGDKMRLWLAAMSHPDGEIGFFNDAAKGIAPNLDSLERYAYRLGLAPLESIEPGLISLPQSGYIRFTGGSVVALIDVAPVGPDYIPGHAHADTLSFELSVAGERVLVNSGTSVYGKGAERLRQRGTAAHNTVEIDGQDSSEVWSGFRVARRAQPIDLRTHMASGVAVVSAAHTGYARLPGRPMHRRTWRLSADAIIVEDSVVGRPGSARAYFHFHPGFELKQNKSGFQATSPSGRLFSFEMDGGEATLESCTWHPEFGISEPNTVVVVTFAGPHLVTRLSWNQAVQHHANSA